MLKLLYIDPWGINGLDDYSNNLVNRLHLYGVKIFYLGNFYSNFNNDDILIRHYFRYSEHMNSRFRIIIRILEYFIGQLSLIKSAIRIQPNIVHIQWSLFFLYDILILLILKLFLPRAKFVFTLHNMVNHTYNDKSLRLFFASKFDYVIVHGKDFYNYLNNNKVFNNKVRVLHHGNKFISKLVFSNMPSEINNIEFDGKKVFLFFGHLKSNKGLKELLDIFSRESIVDAVLIIAGKPHFSTNDIFDECFNDERIIIIKRFIPESEKIFLFELCDLVLIPYSSGSLSGVLFSAASHKKPCLATDFGVISDYIINDETSFVVEISSYEKKVKEILSYSKFHLSVIGNNNFSFMQLNFNWDKITSQYYSFYNEITKGI